MLQLHGKDKTKLAGLRDYKDLCIEYMLNNEDSTLTFVYPKTSKYYDLIEEEEYIKTKKQEYVIKEKSIGDNYTSFKCILNLEDLEGKPWERFESVEHAIDNALALALAGTGWIVGKCSLKKKRTVRVADTSSLGVVQAIRKAYRCDLVFNTLTKTIDVYEKLGEDRGTYFIDSLNLKSLDIQGNSYDYCTRIIPIGKDRLKISDINNGKEYVENYQYSNKIKTIIWKDDRYTIAQNLKEDAEAKLEELSKPYRSYAATILNLAKLNDKYKDILDFRLGDTITLISNSNKFRDKQRIVKIVEYPHDHTKDTVELANTKLSFEEIQQEFQDASNTVNNITTDNGTVDGSTIDGIDTNQIKNFENEVVKVVNIEVVNAKVNHLEAYTVTITGQLTAVQGTIGTLTSNVATIDKLTVTHSAYIRDLQASKADITQFNAVNATIQVLEANVGKIETLVNGNLSSENIQSGGITSDKLTIANGFIKNAMIASLDVSKVNAGDISTNKFRITSDSGNMLISDNTIQIRDNSRVRVQIGKDASNDYNMYVWDSKGNLMFDATGLKEGGIKDKIIRDDMISDDANIDGGKLNINSVVTSINNGTTTIKGSKVQIDGTNQTLDIGFSSLKTEVQGIQIGGRNLLLDSKRERAASPREYLPINITDIAIKNLNKKVTFSGLVRTNGKDGIVMIYSLGKYLINCATSVECTTSEFVRFEMTGQFTYNPNGDNGDNCNLSFYGTYDSGVFPVVKEVKVELGTKATDYTEAPEDIEGEINNIKEITTSQSTTIGIMQGQISTAINNTQIVKDGQTILLKDDYNRTVQTVNSMNSTIGQHSTTISQQTGQITGVTSRINTVERSLDSITARVSSTEANVTNIGYTANNALNKANETQNSLNSKEDKNYRVIYARGTGNDYPGNAIVKIGNEVLLNGQGRGLNIIALNPNTLTIEFRQVYDTFGDSNARANFNNKIEELNNGNFIIIITSQDASYPLNVKSSLEKIGATLFAKDSDTYREAYALIGKSKLGKGNGIEMFIPKTSLDKRFADIAVKVEENGAFSGTNSNNTVEALNQVSQEITETKNKVSGIEVNLTRITSRVSSVETTTSTINGQVSNLSARMNSAEQKITDSSIISTVSSQFYKKGETDGRYAIKSQITQLDNKINLKVDVNGVVSSINQSSETIKIQARKIDIAGVTTIGSSSTGRYIEINNEDYSVYNGNTKCLQFGYKNWNGYTGVPEFLMGYYGMNYSQTPGAGYSSTYFGMATYGRDKNPENTSPYHTIYYRSRTRADESYLNFYEDGRTKIKSMGEFALVADGATYVTANVASGLVFENGFKAGRYKNCEFERNILVNDSIFLRGSNQGITIGKYGGKEEYQLRKSTAHAMDLGHENFKFRNIYATNGTINTSDIRFKENIVPIQDKNIVPYNFAILDAIITKRVLTKNDYYEFVKNLPFYSYDYKDGNAKKESHNIGFIAQDIAHTYVGQEFVFLDSLGKYQYSLQAYIGVLGVALQKAIQEIERLKALK